jgi:muconolactone delta-isomerase
VANRFLVLWKLELNRLSPETPKVLLRQQDYGARLQREGKLLARYHMIGSHGGAWIYDVESNEELDMLLAQAPVYNFASYEVHALADMRQVGQLGDAPAEQ